MSRSSSKLVYAGALFAKGKIKHSYPHSWRSKAPLIYRNTPQWFAAIDRAAGRRAWTAYGQDTIRATRADLDRRTGDLDAAAPAATACIR